MFCRYFLSENLPKTFFAQAQYHMNTGEMLRVIRSHTLEAFFQVMRRAFNLSQLAKMLEKIAIDLKSTWARPPIYHRAYPAEIVTASTAIQ